MAALAEAMRSAAELTSLQPCPDGPIGGMRSRRLFRRDRPYFLAIEVF